jgi:hypothetical protein
MKKCLNSRLELRKSCTMWTFGNLSDCALRFSYFVIQICVIVLVPELIEEVR